MIASHVLNNEMLTARIAEIKERKGPPPWSEEVVMSDEFTLTVICQAPGHPNDHHYHFHDEAWIIAGKSVKPAGLFRGGAGRKYLRLTKSVPGGVTVAVTLERRGGVTAPTTTPLLKAKVASG